MLVAATEKGIQISLLGSQSIPDLQQYREKHTFFCPECKEEVIMKIGIRESRILATKRVLNVQKAMKGSLNTIFLES